MKKIFLILPLFLMACGTTPQTPAQSVYMAQGDYAAALRLELAYSGLPRCKTGGLVVCSDVTIIKKVQKADDVAWISIQEAQTAVRTPGFAESKVTMAVSAASALTKAFVQITATLKVK